MTDPRQRGPLDRIQAGLTPEQYGTAAEAVAQGIRAPGTLVILGKQPAPPGAEQLRAFAEGLGLDAYSARQRLLLPAPRLLRREDRVEEGRRWVAWLKSLEILAFDVSETTLEEFAPLEARSMSAEPEGTRFDDARGNSVTVPWSRVFCLVRGELHYRETRETSHRDLVVGEYRSERETLRATVDRVLDIHHSDGASPVRLRQQTFVFADASGQAPKGSDVAMRDLVAGIRQDAPHAAWHDDFHLVADALGQSVEVLSKSLRSSRHATGGAGVGLATDRVTAQSSAAAFDLYSLLTRLQHVRC